MTDEVIQDLNRPRSKAQSEAKRGFSLVVQTQAFQQRMLGVVPMIAAIDGIICCSGLSAILGKCDLEDAIVIKILERNISKQ